VQQHYGWGGWVHTIFDVLRWPVSLALTVFAVAVLFRHAPRRRQPGLSWLLFGAGIATVLWVATSLTLALYVAVAESFNQTYGALTGIMALLLWANLTGVAFFFGLAFTAQLEGLRVGVPDPAEPDKWKPIEQREPASRKKSAR
jgi:YihY family inner membrane protein